MPFPRTLAGFGAAFLVGAALRLWMLPTQILVDDEWHLVHRLLGDPSLASVATLGEQDHSVGLGIGAWLLMQVTTLDELLLRLPSVVAGVLLVGVVPALAVRFAGRPTAIVLGWLLAVSPLLCFFSRIARPYAITTLLVSVGGFALHRWLRGAGTRAALVYVVTTAAAAVFHLAALPAAMAPFVVWPFVPAEIRPSPWRTVRLGLATILAVAAAMALPALQSGGTVLAKVQTDHMNLSTASGMLELFAGTGHPVAVAVLATFGMVGAVTLVRHDRPFALHVLLVIGLQLAAVVVSGAAAIHVAIVAARYAIVVLPLVLLLVASGLVAVAARIGTNSPDVVGMAGAAALLVIGPMGWVYRYPNDFTNHISYAADPLPGRYFERFRPTTISAFYTDTLAARPAGSTTIVEAPWFFYFHDLAYLQRLHRQHVLIGFVDEASGTVRGGEVARDERHLRLRTAVHLGDRARLKERGVEFVVLHRDPTQELRWPTGVTETPVDMRAWETRYREWFGAPVFEDPQLVVFQVR
jgi:hypothetical protein